MADFWAGYLSGAASIIIGNPLDLIKVRLQAYSSTATTTTPTTPTTLRGLLAGLPAPILTYGAYNALLFTVYNRSLTLLTNTAPPSTAASHHPGWTTFTSGALAGLATFLISTPTELIKCRAQLSATPSWQIAKQTYTASGIAGIYRGGAITSVRDAIGYGFYFWSYEVSKSAWDAYVSGRRQPGVEMVVGAGTVVGEGQRTEALKVLLCGGVAGVATWASIFPLDVIKTRVQAQEWPSAPVGRTRSGSAVSTPSAERTVLLEGVGVHRRPGAWDVALQAFRQEGVAVFCRGLTVCCVRAFIVNAVQWTVYEWIMQYLLI